MKIVQINVVCNGSTGSIMDNLSKKVIEEGGEAYSFYGRGNPGKYGEFFNFFSKFDIYSNVAATRIFDKHGHLAKNSTNKMIEKIKEIKPDVIHLHNIHGYWLNLEILFNYLKQANIPVIWTLHDCWAFTGHCAYFTIAKCEKWKCECNSCPNKKQYPKSILLDSCKSEFNYKKQLFTGIKNLIIVTPSNWLSDLVKESFLNEYQVNIINNGIDTNIFKPKFDINIRKKYNISSSKKIILGVASTWDERKGLNTFLKLAEEIDDKHIIFLVGLNKKQISKLPKNIIGIKRTENINELVNIYSQADMFLNPTLEDNFPTTNLEAIACGLPVITYNTGGSPECIDDTCGYTVKNNTLNETINYIKNIKTNKNICLKKKNEDMLKKYYILYGGTI